MYSPNRDPPGLPRTPYLDGAGAALAMPALEGETRADVVVVGGGIAGASLALHAAEAGTRVVLLEAKEVGWGASGRNSGHVPPATKLEPEAILRAYGPEHGPRIVAASRQGPDLVFGLAETHRMGASPVRSGVIQAAHTAAALRKLEKRTAYLQSQGYAVDLLDRRATAALIGSDPGYYSGSSLDRHGGTINPLAYVRGLARAAHAAGARIHERSTVTRLARGAGKWRVETEHGSVAADFVALCTNAYTGALWPGLRQTIVPVRAYQFMTRPISENLRRSILPGGQGMTDTRRLMSGIRIHADGRLHFSGQGPIFGVERLPDLAPSLARVAAIFPQLGPIELEYWWSGWMAMNSENSWKIHEPAPALLAALGCNGRGVAIATTIGRELARYVGGTPARDLVMPFSPLRRIAAYPIHRPLVRALVAYYKLRDALETRAAPSTRRKAA